MTLKIAANEKFKNTAVSVLRLPFQVACFFAWAFQDQWLSVGNKFFLSLFTFWIIYLALQLCDTNAHNPATAFNSLIKNFALFFNFCFSFGGNSTSIAIGGYLLKIQSEIAIILRFKWKTLFTFHPLSAFQWWEKVFLFHCEIVSDSRECGWRQNGMK